MRLATARCAAALAAFLFFPGWPAAALQFTNTNNPYISAVNDRFSGGFPTNPVANTSTSFVGAGYDWSGVGWSTTTHAAGSYKGFGVLSPLHFLTAQHYEYTNNSEKTTGVRLLGADGSVVSQPVAAVTNLGYGLVLSNHNQINYDLALGRLDNPITQPGNFFRMGVLDLYSTSTASNVAVYNNLPVLVYGRGSSTTASPRVGEAAVALSTNLSGNPLQSTLLVNKQSVQLEGGDSGSPLLHGWTNANGGKELAVVGLNSAVTADTNYMSLLAVPGAMANVNTTMTQDGFALRVVGNSSNTWVGSSSTSITNKGAWGIVQGNQSAPSDRYVTFNGATATSRAVDVDSAANLRGLYFRSTTNSSLGFTFSGNSTLTNGRGGIVNYDIARQTFTANLLLGDHQYWDGGVGGLTISNLNSNGKLLEITGAGTNRITGNMSGAGGLAVSGGRLEVTASNSYTGATWVHGGRLVVNGRIDTSSGVNVGTYGSLGGSGRVAAISGSGSIDPGNSPGILTAPSVNPTGGLDFNFEFTLLGSPNFANAFASGNDLLRLTAATPFTAALGSVNTVNIYMSFASLNPGDAFRGGFFADQVGDFLASVSGANFFYYLADDDGDFVYEGIAYRSFDDYDIVVGTVAQTANFTEGTVTGGIMEFTVVPEPSTYALLVLGAGAVALVMWRRRRGVIPVKN
jgi:autotransporter-associated beta strand protein